MLVMMQREAPGKRGKMDRRAVYILHAFHKRYTKLHTYHIGELGISI